MNLPEQITLDFDGLTLGELEDVEDLTGLSSAAIGRLLSEGDQPMRVTRAMIFVTLRRDRPDLTFEETRGIKVSAITAPRQEAEVDADDPTPLPVASLSGTPEA